MAAVDGDAQRARDAFARRAWSDAYELSVAAGEELDAGDHYRLAVTAYLIGRERESADAFARAYQEHMRIGEQGPAARSAFWLAVTLMLRGEMAPAGGWLARAERIAMEINDVGLQSLLIIPAVLGALGGGDAAAAEALAIRQMEAAGTSRDEDVLAMARLSRGESLLAAGDIGSAMKLFDEVMIAVTTGDVSPIAAGIVYCAVIDACMRACDIRRAAQWTDVLQRWCESQQGLVPYRGQCFVHRSQVLQASGAWPEAMAAVERAQRHLSDPPHPALGMALYQQGELHRLRGEFDKAEAAYRAGSELGRDPRPGFALLRLAQGNRDAAAAAVRRMLEESRGHFDRPAVLGAASEVLLAAGDLEAARAAADELESLAGRSGVALLRAMADYATGSVLLHAGKAAPALSGLRRACTGWRDLGMTYDSARARVRVALACRALGDEDTAGLELDGARAAFESLGAGPDLAIVDGLLSAPPLSPDVPLTDRECEVLQLVAAGKTNREIAATLVISEHTVARHLQNMFLKLGLSSRAAATAYAYEHGLV